MRQDSNTFRELERIGCSFYACESKLLHCESCVSLSLAIKTCCSGHEMGVCLIEHDAHQQGCDRSSHGLVPMIGPLKIWEHADGHWPH